MAVRMKFTAVIERDGAWFLASCPEIPGANGQGSSPAEAKGSLVAAVALIRQDGREDALRGLPPDAVQEIVEVS